MEHRSRTPNFSEKEVILLEKLIARSSCILENKAAKAEGWKEKKNEWRKLTIQFNSQNSRFRTAETLRKKWDNMKKIRQNLIQRKKHTTPTEGEPAASEPNNQVKEECTMELKTPATGPESMFDCDGDSSNDFVLYIIR